MEKWYVAVVACLLAVQTPCHGYGFFRQQIPNGEIVPHPCKANNLWRGVGHENLNGGGARNPFGIDFAANGKKWDEVLCNKDSDGDGLTNGEELGDPNCIWTVGATPTRTLGISHPGICDPVTDEAKCGPKPSYVDCSQKEFECAVLDEPNTFNYTVRIPETAVPAEETSYVCMLFELPVDKPYHLVAHTPHIDNVNVMHHIVIYGCTGDVPKSDMNTVRDCNMGSGHESCQEIIGTWSVGISGSCEHPHTGFLVGGTGGYKFASFQFHWNNPEFSSNYTDSSGINFFLTPDLRLYNAGVMTIGQTYLEIPPRELTTRISGGCSGKCTRQYLTEAINITTVFNHMHYLGKAQYTEIRRNGIRTDILAHDDVYNYDNPIIRFYPDPIVARPGDELNTQCVFQSTSRQETTYFGDGTSDEMCLSFLTYYPKEKVTQEGGSCVKWMGIDVCDFETGTVQGCDYYKLYDVNGTYNKNINMNLEKKCSTSHCRKECKEYVKALKATDPCFQGDYYRLRKQGFDSDSNSIELKELEFFSRVDSCDVEIAIESFMPGGPTDGATGLTYSLVVGLSALVAHMCF